jgi:GxxExxY protein
MDQDGIKADEAGALSGERFIGTEDDLTSRIIGVFYKVFNELGFGFLESVYRKSMAIALREAGLSVLVESPIAVTYHGELVGAFRADIVVEEKIVLELKTAEQIAKAHEAQLLHYLRASTMEIGLILNFGQLPKCRRVEFRNDRKQHIAKSVFIPS